MVNGAKKANRATLQNNIFEEIHKKADAAARKAVSEMDVKPMVVGYETSFMSGVIDPNKKTYFVEGGPCGFAWVNIKPANSAFAKFLMSKGKVSKDNYRGGVTLWVSDYGQSEQRKACYAHVYAEVIEKEIPGIKAYADSRLD